MHYTSREVYEFISKQTNDPIVERKTCAISGQPFAIYQSDVNFYAKISPTFNGQKFSIPTPTLCPEERQRRRLSFRNERKLYRRQCDASKKSIISIYSSDKPYKVYDQKIRRSDSRDPMDYGMDFDFSKTFSQQFKKLISQVPFMNIMNDNGINSINSEYCNNFSYGKNCYMIHTSRHGEDSLYCSSCQHIKDTIDSDGMGYTNNCYSCIDCNKIQSCIYLENSDDCSYCCFGNNLKGCNHCFGCTNLINQSYCILNKSYSQEAYNSIINKSKSTLIPEYTKLKQESFKKSMPINNCTDCCGGGIFDSSNILFGYNIYRGKDCKYYFGGSDSPRSSYDITVGGDHDYGYESIVPDFSYNSLFTVYCWKSKYIYYSFDCHNSSNLFGCIGLRNKSYCIFNKQYTKEAYEKQVAKIITHMMTTRERGEFFHPSLSPFGYNETVAQEYFPLDMIGTSLASSNNGQDESRPYINLQNYGYHRSTYNADPSLPTGVQTIEKKNYTDEQRTNLLQQENLETQVFLCSVSGRPYRLQKTEIAFYRKHHLPIPDKHPDIRHEERMKLRPGRTLFLRNCDCCNKEMLSVYAPKEVPLGDTQDHEGKVYCETCYQQEVYS